MDKETLEALKGSIKKWEGIVTGTRGDGGILDCPLCQKFHWRGDPNTRRAYYTTCRGCPVMEKTGESGCIGSPYEEFGVAERAGFEAESREYAQQELEFLRSLLPKEEKGADDL